MPPPPERPEISALATAALDAALEAIPAPAVVVRAPASILLANARARTLLATDRERVMEVLRAPPAADARTPARFAVEGHPGHALVVLPDLDGDARHRVQVISRRWGLTPRQAAVLARVAQGDTNRTVASRLGCSEKTIELHVSALLAKTRCTSRSHLVATFWTDPCDAARAAAALR
ncbi:transcriptional regulator, LuxR family [Anaeromyxobacter sp. K]|uniref:response regulator transcription factor n=1 Tax=Anaeromyxobacter sp. (strain K) TaxID=447217 RepID=UPI00015F8E90|nr:LuxR family transcriptional regulator [Anaeromyxobacter sp. K]ACG71986.1 transcriptional regulator, LuxR family [Anaeromyxobacter sp. K]